jgi:hypothetical protein
MIPFAFAERENGIISTRDFQSLRTSARKGLGGSSSSSSALAAMAIERIFEDILNHE